MADLRTQSNAPLAAPRDGLGTLRVLRSFAASFLVNGLFPFLVYKLLEPHFPKGSILPLVGASLFPLLALLIGIVRKRMVDMVALLVLLGISVNIAAIFLTPDVKWALAARSLTGILTATLLLLSVLVRRPLFYYVARQFVATADPSRLAGFEAANAADRLRTFTVTTIVWAFGVYALCAINITLALTLPPASYLIASQVTGAVVIVSLVIFTIRFTRSRLTRVAAR